MQASLGFCDGRPLRPDAARAWARLLAHSCRLWVGPEPVPTLLPASLQATCLTSLCVCTVCSSPAGYAQGAAAGFSCGAARGAEVALRALAPRLPDVAAKLQDARQQQTAQQPGAAGNEGSPTQQLAAMPYQQLQRRVCEALMASPAQPACTPASASTGEPGPRPAVLPDDVASALQASCNTMQLLGLQALPARGR